MRAMLDLEDSAPEVLRVQIPGAGIPLWPLARWPISRAIAETDIGTTVPTYARRPLSHRVISAARAALPNPRASRSAPRADHLFVVSGWTKAPGADGFANWLSDDFALALGDDADVVQDAYLDLVSRGDQRPANPRTFSFARANQRVTRATAGRPLSPAARAELERTLRGAFAALDHPVTEAGRERAIADALGRADRARHAAREFGRLLDRVAPRRIYMQTAAYGVRAAEIALAHERGIEVAELQHGWIGSSHAAYNFGAVMHEHDLVRCLPDTLLSYGEFWGRDIRFPGRVVPIGKPTLDRTRLHTTPWAQRSPRVLFVSSNYAHDVVDRTLLALRGALPAEWRIVLRPHPVERATAASRHAEALANDGIELDLSADAAAAIGSSRAVVGFSSTMLFEALAYGCHVAVVDSPLADHYASVDVFPSRISADLSDLAGAATAFLTPPSAVDQRIADSVWQPDAVSSFLAFART
jgi:hypothetical protein